MTGEGERLAREVGESMAKEKNEEMKKREFLRKSIRDGNKTVSKINTAINYYAISKTEIIVHLIIIQSTTPLSLDY